MFGFRIRKNKKDVLTLGKEDLQQILVQVVMGAPTREIRIKAAAELICTCMMGFSIPQVERSNVEAWEGKSPRDEFERLIPFLITVLPGPEDMVETWNSYVEIVAQRISESSEGVPDTIPDSWQQ
jgi:hypothetical protein